MIVALGSTYAGLMSNDDALRRRCSPRPASAAARSSGGCRCTRSTTSWSRAPTPTSTTPPEARKAGTIVGGTFLSNFVGEMPWAHLDIAGSAWDLGRAYVGKGASGYGVRLLVELARRLRWL